MHIIERERMEPLLDDPELLRRISNSFQAFSEGRANVPPPGELIFDKPRGETHIKFGAIDDCPIFVVKVASSFYDNPKRGLSSSQGAMLALERDTGRLAAVLLDGGLLTDTRTAIAGALCAQALAPREVRCIGIVGTGIQARLQLKYLKNVTLCREAMVWGRNAGHARDYAEEMATEGFRVNVASDLESLAKECRLIVTTTPSHEALLLDHHVQRGTHITAVGSDTPDKQELDVRVVGRADRVVADSRAHCQTRGEISQALRAGTLTLEKVNELGKVLTGISAGRQHEDEITIADLTGLAVQDIAIAQFVLERCLEGDMR